MSEVLNHLWREEEGQDLVEYTLLVGPLALASVAGTGSLSNNINNAFSAAGNSLSTQAT